MIPRGYDETVPTLPAYQSTNQKQGITKQKNLVLREKNDYIFLYNKI